jgi:hypothetical protein
MLPFGEAAVSAECCNRPVPRAALLRVLGILAIGNTHFVSIFQLVPDTFSLRAVGVAAFTVFGGLGTVYLAYRVQFAKWQPPK